MEKNVGHPIDKAIRIVIGIVLLSLIFILQGDIRWVGLIGIIPIVTAAIGWCPGWVVLGINTCKTK